MNQLGESRFRLAGLWAMTMCLGFVSAWAQPNGTDPTVWRLKTPAPSSQSFRPYLDAGGVLRSALDGSSNGPANAGEMLTRMKGLSAAFIESAQALESAIRQNGEISAFDAVITARLQKRGLSTALAEISRRGGPFQMVANTRSSVDEDIADLTSRIGRGKSRASFPGAPIVTTIASVLRLLEVDQAYGRSSGCATPVILWYIAMGVEPSFCSYR